MAVALGTRDGDSVRGGSLGDLADGPIANLAALDAVIDRAVTAVGAARGIAVALPASGGEAGGTVDVAALGEFTEQLTGRTGVLATAARTVLRQLGLDDAAVFDLDVDDEAAVLADRVAAELGADWVRAVAPAFDDRRAVLLDDRWAGARADLAGLWLTDADDLDAEFTQQTEAFRGAGRRSRSTPPGGRARPWPVAAMCTRGCSPRSPRWPPIPPRSTPMTSPSSPVPPTDPSPVLSRPVAARRRDRHRDDLAPERRPIGILQAALPRQCALWCGVVGRPGEPGVPPDVDALVEWIGDEQSQTLGGATEVVKPAMRPTLLFPFAAPRGPVI